MSILMPQAAIQAPSLLVPRRKPTGPVRLDRANSLCKDIAFYRAYGPVNNTDLVSGNRAVIGASSGYVNNKTGQCLESNVTNDGGEYVDIQVLPSSVTGYPLTVMMLVELDIGASQWATLLGNPYSTSSWAAPYWNFDFCRYSTSTNMGIAVQNSAHSNYTYSATIGYDTANGPTLLGVTFGAGNSQNIIFFRMDSTGLTTDTVSPAATFDGRVFSTITRWATFNEGNTSPPSDQGFNGRVWWTGVWFRKFSTEMITSMFNNPYQILLPA